MKPILFPSAQTQFNNNGIGTLSDAASCLVTQEVNGQYELVLRYPVKGKHFLHICMRAIILAKVDPVSELQPFRVYNISKPSGGIVTINARHIVYDHSGIAVAPFTADTAPDALIGLKTNSATNNPFSYFTDKTTAASFSVAVPKTAWSLFGGSAGSILDVYGGEYEYDRYQVNLLTRRGADRGVSIRYGKNLTSLQQDENCANCYTGVMPYWQSRTSGTVVMLSEKILKADGTFDYTKILPIDVTSMITLEELEDDAEILPTEDQIRAAARKYMTDNKIGEPVVSWIVQFVQLEQTEEYKGKALLERVLLGDTVSVEFPALNVSATARAVSCVYNCLMERYESITLGSVKANLASTIANQGASIVKQENLLDAKPGMSQVQKAVEAMTATLLGAAGGCVRLLDDNGDGVPDTLYIADDPDPAAATKVWRFNYEGWGASSNGYNGPFEMGATFDDGILADFIRAGTLNAGLIKTGVLKSADGGLQIDLASGTVSIDTTPAGSDQKRRIDITKYGIEGFGWDVDDQKSVRTFLLTPGVVGEGFDGMALTAYNKSQLRITCGNSAKELVLGNLIQPTLINGKYLSIKPGKTVLFSGDEEMSNSFEVPGTDRYDLFAIRLGTSDDYKPGVILAYKEGNTIYGTGGWGGSTEYYKNAMYFSATFEGDNWTYIYGSTHHITMAGAWGSGTKLHIREIIGII